MTAFADLYGFHPKSRLYLGAGVDKFQPHKAFLDCVSFDPLEILNGKPIINTSLEVTGVKSAYDFYQKIGFSSFLEGSYLFMQGESSVNYNFEEAFSENNLTWLVLLKAEYGARRLKNFKLKPEFQSLSQKDLLRKCGREIVVEEKRSIMLFVLVTLKNLTHSQKEELSAKLSFGATGSLGKVNFSAEYKKFLQQALSLGQVGVKIYSHGNFPLSPLKNILAVDLLTNHDNLLGLFEQYLQGIDANASAPRSFVTTDIGLLANESFDHPLLKEGSSKTLPALPKFRILF